MTCVLCYSSFSFVGILPYVCAWALFHHCLCSTYVPFLKFASHNPKVHRAEPASPQFTGNMCQNKCLLSWVTKLFRLFIKTNKYSFLSHYSICTCESETSWTTWLWFKRLFYLKICLFGSTLSAKVFHSCQMTHLF